MSTITNLETTSTGADSRTIINTNFDNLNDDKLEKSGGVITGEVSFSGTTHAGVKLLSLTTVQRDALTPANGMIIYNSTTAQVEFYQDGAWTATTGASDASATVKGLVEIATQAEIDAGTGTGGTGAVLAVSPDNLATSIYKTQLPSSDQKAALAGTSGTPGASNKYVTNDDATATPTASKVVRATSTGKINGLWGYTHKSFNAGETITGATLPVAVYQNATDNEIYACDGNDTAKLQFIGFAVSNGTDGNSITVQTNGIVSGFTGLEEGNWYYVSDTKTITSTSGTYIIPVGIAISETELLIQQKEYLATYASGTLQISNDDKRSTAELNYTKIKETKLGQDLESVRINFDMASDATGKTHTGRIYKNGVAIGTERIQSSSDNDYDTFSEDFTGLKKGDLIQIYAKTSNAIYLTYVKNLRFYYDLNFANKVYTNQDI